MNHTYPPSDAFRPIGRRQTKTAACHDSAASSSASCMTNALLETRAPSEIANQSLKLKTSNGSIPPSLASFNAPNLVSGSVPLTARLTQSKSQHGPSIPRRAHSVTPAASPASSSSNATDSSPKCRIFSPNYSPSSSASSICESTGSELSRVSTNTSTSNPVQQQTQLVWPVQQSRKEGTGLRPHPRRTSASVNRIRPTLIRQDQRRSILVEQLVDTATELVALIWPGSSASEAFPNKVISLRFFIRETLRRSRTSYSTLQLTLWYLVLVRPHVATIQKSYNSNTCSNAGAASLCCGRRMFLAALILASKFLQDRNFTARAWSKITGLSTQEITSNETKYLAAIDWNLYLKREEYQHWNCIVARCTEATQLGRSIKDTWAVVLAEIGSGLSLHHVSKVVATTFHNKTLVSAQTSWSATNADGTLTPPCSFDPSRELSLASQKLEDDSVPLVTGPQPSVPELSQSSTIFSSSSTSPCSELSTNTIAVTPMPEQCSQGVPTVFVPETPLADARRIDETASRRSQTIIPPPRPCGIGGNWDVVRSEFPMDVLRTPEVISSLSRTSSYGPPTNYEAAVQNKAFGTLTPSPRVDQIQRAPSNTWLATVLSPSQIGSQDESRHADALPNSRQAARIACPASPLALMPDLHRQSRTSLSSMTSSLSPCLDAMSARYATGTKRGRAADPPHYSGQPVKSRRIGGSWDSNSNAISPGNATSLMVL